MMHQSSQRVKIRTFPLSTLIKILKLYTIWLINGKFYLTQTTLSQAIEASFSQKRDKDNYPSLIFIGKKVQLVPSQKDFGLVLDSQLDFNEHKQ